MVALGLQARVVLWSMSLSGCDGELLSPQTVCAVAVQWTVAESVGGTVRVRALDRVSCTVCAADEGSATIVTADRDLMNFPLASRRMPGPMDEVCDKVLFVSKLGECNTDHS